MARDTTTPSAGPGGGLISASRRGREKSVPCLPSQLDIEREANGLGQKQPVLLDGYYILRHTQEEGRMSGQEPVALAHWCVCARVRAFRRVCVSVCVECPFERPVPRVVGVAASMLVSWIKNGSVCLVDSRAALGWIHYCVTGPPSFCAPGPLRPSRRTCCDAGTG